MGKRRTAEQDKEIYRLWIDYLRNKDAFKTAIVEFNNLDIFKRLYGFVCNLKPLSKKEDVINHDAKLEECSELLQTVLSSLKRKIKNREVALYYLIYFLFFYDIFSPSYSFENWWEWQTDKGKKSPPSMATLLISMLIQGHLNNSKPKTGDNVLNIDLSPTFFRPTPEKTTS